MVIYENFFFQFQSEFSLPNHKYLLIDNYYRLDMVPKSAQLRLDLIQAKPIKNSIPLQVKKTYEENV